MSEITLESQLIDIIKDEDMAENIKLAKVDMLIRLGVNVNAMYGSRSPLRFASDKKESKIMEFLKNNGAEEVFDKEKAEELGGELFDVCGEDYADIENVKELIDKGASVNIIDESGNTILMEATEKRRKEIVELLLKNGADDNYNCYYDICGSALIVAAENGYNEIVELLILNGSDVNTKNNKGQNAMMIAKNEETKKAIIEAVKKRNEKTCENVVI